ncbi:MAGUK p55 sub member 4 [Saguinus oedipus]|uniref:MAGUK p55 sub member 4 n=1 Tax=Saguinus oedipus TaxID=9490 RepID=A0ABQ9VZ96_SAGOE|nr:MAGUK p55 sub member 4 [Saguinus oedipus]
MKLAMIVSVWKYFGDMEQLCGSVLHSHPAAWHAEKLPKGIAGGPKGRGTSQQRSQEATGILVVSAIPASHLPQINPLASAAACAFVAGNLTSAPCNGSCYSAVGAPYEEVVKCQRHPSDKYRLTVLVGCSGVGSYEMNGHEYHCVSKETFESLIYGHRMLEHGEYRGHLYGTSVDAVQTVLDEGKVCVMDLGPQDVQVAPTHELKPYVIFIKPLIKPNMRCMK